MASLMPPTPPSVYTHNFLCKDMQTAIFKQHHELALSWLSLKSTSARSTPVLSLRDTLSMIESMQLMHDSQDMQRGGCFLFLDQWPESRQQDLKSRTRAIHHIGHLIMCPNKTGSVSRRLFLFLFLLLFLSCRIMLPWWMNQRPSSVGSSRCGRMITRALWISLPCSLPSF